MSHDLRLHYAPDNASLAVRLALEELRLPYETVLVDRAARAQASAAYRAINPAGRIPALETPAGPMFETGAILLWLADSAPGRLFPAPAAPERGVALSWLFWLSNTLHPAERLLFYPSDAPGAGRDALREGVLTHLDTVEAAGAPVMASLGPTILDCYLAPLLRWPQIYPAGGPMALDPVRWPGLFAIARAMERRPSARAAIAAEGLGENPFTAPRPPRPPEGSAT